MKISVITINYNNAIGLRKTIESVVYQTYKNYEFIVIDGGSTDDSTGIINEYASNISYWVSEPDKGIYNAMNKGVKVAKGDYCIFMNSGDCFYDENVFQQFANNCQQEDIIVGLVYNNSNNRLIFAPPQKEISLYYLYSSTVPHQGSFIKTSLQKQYPYDESLKIVADWFFFVQTIIQANCSIKHVNFPVAKFDLEGISTSNPQATWKEKEMVLSKLFPPRILADYQQMKASECLTQSLTPRLRIKYRIDKCLYRIGTLLLKFAK